MKFDLLSSAQEIKPAISWAISTFLAVIWCLVHISLLLPIHDFSAGTLSL